MKNIINILILIALLAIIVLQLRTNKNTVEDKVYHFDKEQAIQVETQTIALNKNAQNSLITGNFMPNKVAKINSEIQAKIISIHVDNGSVVRKGQKLITLDNRALKLKLNELDIKMDGLKTDIARYKILSDADAIQGVQLEKSELALKSVEASRSIIVDQMSKSVIYAPFNGVITMKMTEIGSFANPAMPLLELTDLNTLKFTVNVPESDLGLFEENSIHPITIDALPELKLQGKTSMIASKGNMGNSFSIEFDVENTKNHLIKSGMFGKIRLENKDATSKIVIPASLIVGSNVAPQVYLVTNGKATLQDVVISKRFENKVLIESGLKEGDVIVSNGFINLYDGVNVASK